MTQSHFSLPPAMPTTRQPLSLAIWPTSEPTDPGRRRHDHGFAGLRLADIEQAEIGGEPGDPIDAEQMRHRLHVRQLDELLGGKGRIVLPASVGEHEISRLEAGGPRGDHLGDRDPGHDGAGPDGGAIGRTLHPGAIGGVERDELGAHEDLAVLRFGRHPLAQRKVFRGKLSVGFSTRRI